MSRTNDTHSTEQPLPTSDRDVVYVGYRQSGQAIVEKRPETNGSRQCGVSRW